MGLEVKDWTVHHPLYHEKIVDNKVSFKVHKGEVVGFSGLQGAGRTELAMSIFGKSYGTNISGELYLNGERVELKSPEQAIRHGLAYVTEDRKTNGLILGESIRFNTTLACLDKVCGSGVIDTIAEQKAAEEMTAAMGTTMFAEFELLTHQMVEEGKSVIMISSEMPELIGMCDRIYIMNEGELKGELYAEEATQEKIMSYIISADH